MKDAAPQANNPPEDQKIQSKKSPKILYRILGVLLILVAMIVAWLLVVGFLGYQSGQRLLAEKQAAELQNTINRQIQLAGENIAEGNIDLAVSRLNWVLEREPENGQAKALLQETVSNPTEPAAAPVEELTPTAVPEPTVTPGLIVDPAQELQRLRRLTASKAWQDALPALIAFQMQFPNYERRETDEMLYNTYLEYGIDLINSDNIETGLFYLSQAEKLGDLPQSALDYRLWATLYTQGISYYGVNWELTAYFFRDLCLAAPFYQNACDILYESLVNSGDIYAANMDWCPALAYYEEAGQHNASGDFSDDLSGNLTDKLTEAREGCAMATPTPTAPITDTLTITGTQPITSPFIIPLPTPTP